MLASAEETSSALAVGLIAGLLGGLLGIGGSIVMIPGLALTFPNEGPEGQHLFQASAMAVNIAVSAPAALRHHRAGFIRWDVFRVLMPTALCTIVLGVLCSNLIDGLTLRRLFAVFLVYVAVANIVRVFRRIPDRDASEARVTTLRSMAVGGVMGAFAGLLGIGGGVVAVPLMLIILRLPLKQCIATSSAAMMISAILGGAIKIATIGGHLGPAGEPFTIGRALLLAGLMAPTAIVGGWVGASLTHRLPLEWVRGVFALALLIAAWRMSGF